MTRYKPSIEADFDRADLVISHAGKCFSPSSSPSREVSVCEIIIFDLFTLCSSGSGSILEALRKKKKTIVAVNTNLMDNHQLELAQKLAEEGYLDYCLPKHIEQVRLHGYVRYLRLILCLLLLSKAVERASDREFKEFPKQDSSLFAHELCAHLAAIECNR